MNSISDFDRNKADKILSAIKNGAYFDDILDIAEINEETLEDWLDKGSKENAPPSLSVFHKEFIQTVGNAAKGVEKLLLRRAAKSIRRVGYVYFIKESAMGKVKIGFTETSPYKRIASLQTSCPQDLNLFALIESENAMKLEKQIHKELKDFLFRLEWYSLTDNEIDSVLRRYGGRYITDTIWQDHRK